MRVAAWWVSISQSKSPQRHRERRGPLLFMLFALVIDTYFDLSSVIAAKSKLRLAKVNSSSVTAVMYPSVAELIINPVVGSMISKSKEFSIIKLFNGQNKLFVVKLKSNE